MEYKKCARCRVPFAPWDNRVYDNNEQYCQVCGKKIGEERDEIVRNQDYVPVAQLFKCLGDPCRVKIIQLLSRNSLRVFEFVDIMGSQYSAVSYHLKMLKELGLVKSYEDGNFVVYSLTDKGETVHEFINKSITLK